VLIEVVTKEGEREEILVSDGRERVRDDEWERCGRYILGRSHRVLMGEYRGGIVLLVE